MAVILWPKPSEEGRILVIFKSVTLMSDMVTKELNMSNKVLVFTLKAAWQSTS